MMFDDYRVGSLRSAILRVSRFDNFPFDGSNVSSRPKFSIHSNCIWSGILYGSQNLGFAEFFGHIFEYAVVFVLDFLQSISRISGYTRIDSFATTPLDILSSSHLSFVVSEQTSYSDNTIHFSVV